MARLEPKLRMGEAQWCLAGRRVRLVANAIPGLLSPRAVIAQSVGLDYEPEVGK